MAIRTTACRDGIFVSWSLAFHGAVARALCAIVFASAPIMAASGEPAAPSVPDRAASHAPASPSSGAPDETPARLAPMLARVAERLTQKDIGLVINTADPYSVDVGEFYFLEIG